ncbi:MAG TPA: hypothetical protein VGY55_20305 [Pirellulales bacterium]|nr:hypothetical protein [Pirellulales bacterium]
MRVRAAIAGSQTLGASATQAMPTTSAMDLVRLLVWETNVKRVAGLILLLVATVWLLAQIDAPSTLVKARAAFGSPWRRTTNGWERSDQWLGRPKLPDQSASEPAHLPHPVTLALFELFGATLFLLASPPDNSYFREK